ncbi:cytochrome p450 [Hirsutella rhossiliensis]|uniref:Cytochrome p450 domain-containing protein n=1 Tax=Hirsutella rhossiliensis TaxID=111463 RepID=A0A9P8SIV1_9HYPO|nr:cytochrome p450 domain-containing protein [Hirsutella rhossiliensis]KAH0964593.1 cytochrome p450 domain-containing protein [Hirsutella rhossiliensis]
MLRDILGDLPRWASAALGLACLLVLWRTWKFTLRPLLWPSEPKNLPYWVPCHTVGFFRSSDKLIERGLDYTGRTHEPFAVELLGKTMYVVTAPGDVAAAFRDSAALNFDGNLAQLLENFGVKHEAFKRAWHKPQPGDWSYVADNAVKPAQLDLIHFVEETYKTQLLPGPHMDSMCRVFLDSVHSSLRWDALRGGCAWCGLAGAADTAHNMKTAARPPVSLLSLCRRLIAEAATRSLFGRLLHDISPGVVDDILEFNDYAWMVVFRYLDLLEIPVTAPQRRLMATLSELIELPEHSRGEAAWAIRQTLAAFEIVDIDTQSRAAMMLMSFWALTLGHKHSLHGAVSNEYNLTFWILAHLLYDEALLRPVRQETEAAWRAGRLDVKHLCANSTRLHAVFNETLRLRNGAGALRVVTQQTVIGGKVLAQGHSILIPFRQLHTNEAVWGPTVGAFDPSRFLNRKSLARHSSFRPFGGGTTYCPGRILAREEVYGFIAVLLHRFDVALHPDAGEQPFPRFNDTVPSLGVSGPLGGMDVLVDLAPREVPA